MNNRAQVVGFALLWLTYSRFVSDLKDSLEVKGIDESSHEDKRFKCDICNYKTKFKWNLKRHMKLHSETTGVCQSETQEKDQLVCHRCGKTFKSRCGLSLHVRGKHTLQFRFLCSICAKGFMSKYSYRGHMAFHNKVSEQKCPMCPATFRYRSSLIEHSKVQHQGMEFICNREGCSKKFASSSSLGDHCRAVHDKRYYSCSKCSKKFNWRSSLRFHEQNAHGKM